MSVIVGKPNLDEEHPDYVPNVFPFSKGKIRSAKIYEMHKKRHENISKKQKEVKEKKENCEAATSSQPENIVSGN